MMECKMTSECQLSKTLILDILMLLFFFKQIESKHSFVSESFLNLKYFA